MISMISVYFAWYISMIIGIFWNMHKTSVSYQPNKSINCNVSKGNQTWNWNKGKREIMCTEAVFFRKRFACRHRLLCHLMLDLAHGSVTSHPPPPAGRASGEGGVRPQTATRPWQSYAAGRGETRALTPREGRWDACWAPGIDARLRWIPNGLGNPHPGIQTQVIRQRTICKIKVSFVNWSTK